MSSPASCMPAVKQRLHAGADEKRRLARKAEHFEPGAVGGLGDAREVHPGGDVLQPHVDERIVVRAMAEVATQRAGGALRVIQVRARQAVVDEQRHALLQLRREIYANAGIGAASQLCGMLIMQALDTQVTTVPYQGTGPALTDLMGGQVDFMCDQTTNTTNPIKAGSIKAYAVLTEERLDALPDVPTAAEGGLEGIQIGIWHGLYAPAGTPDDIVATLADALVAALADETVAQRFAELGTEPVPPDQATPQALQDKLLSEIDRWKPVIEEAGVFAE